MKCYFPSYFCGHIVALAGVLTVHIGLAAWAMMPEPPVAIPQQQIIQVSMVAPTMVAQKTEPIQTVKVAKEIPKVPPKSKGMLKVEKKPEVIEKVEEKKEEKEKPKIIVKEQTRTQLTSGIQSADAKETKSAMTKPVAANYLKNPPPEYPRSARRRNQQGTVMLDVRVMTNGNPKHIRIEESSGYAMLDEAALAAVKQWKFVPAKRGSQLVEANVVVPIEFRIN